MGEYVQLVKLDSIYLVCKASVYNIHTVYVWEPSVYHQSDKGKWCILHIVYWVEFE